MSGGVKEVYEELLMRKVGRDLFRGFKSHCA